MSKVESKTKTASKNRPQSPTLPKYRGQTRKGKTGNTRKYSFVEFGPVTNRQRVYFGEYNLDKNSESQKAYRKWCVERPG